MHDLLARNWWALLARGVAALLFGVVALALPGLAVGVLIAIFGAFTLVDGIFAIVAGLRASARHQRWGSLILGGVAGVLVGIIALVAPLAAAVGIVYLVAIWAIIVGVTQIMAAFRLRRVIENEWLMALSGALSLGLGVLFLAAPGIAIVTLSLWLGIFALISGAVLVALAFRVRRGPVTRVG